MGPAVGHHSFIPLVSQSCAHSTFIEQVLRARNGLSTGGWEVIVRHNPRPHVAGGSGAGRQEGIVRIREMWVRKRDEGPGSS